ncbi:MAG TPA: tetratricopeptide repeat protein [Hyalangium sp.]|nr:tetratricopeptide repeat protein [Hyalangium sp.]
MEQHVETTEIARYLRGELPAERAGEVERHLVTCRQCAERISSESLSLTQVPSLPVMESSSPAKAASSGTASSGPPGEPRHRGEEGLPGRGDPVGRYLILERVGQGGMGVVYAAWDPDLGRRVAIKLLRTDKPHAEGRSVAQARLLREAQAMAKVSHPHVISIFDVSTLGEDVFLAMEYVDGSNLRRWLKEQPRPWRQVLDVYLAAGRGLAGAHAAGLVHRDFKPDNVLLGKDGRVRVTDFGLARLAAEEEAEAGVSTLPDLTSLDDGPGLSQLTREGVVVGTPRFMAPEQIRGSAPDARSDQFSFCVALYHALYGDWPLENPRPSAPGADSSRGSSRKGASRPSEGAGGERPADPATGVFLPPRDSQVPGFVWKVLLRGLSPAPKDRFPSMEALLAQLEAQPRKARRVAVAASLALVMGAGGYAWYAIESAQASRCTGLEQRLAGLWDEGVRRQVTEALVATAKPGAADVAVRATRMLDDYARGWVEMSTEACRATRIRGEQTESLLSLRMLCLERRLKDVKAVTGVLASADAELVEKAVDTVSLLPSLRSCADVTSLSQVEPLPESPQARAEIERISSQVSQLKALTDAGRYKQGMEVGEPALSAARALGYRPLEAEALLWLGTLEARRDEVQAAERHLIQSLWAALASRDDEVQARAATMLVYVVGGDSKRFDAALQWGDMARATLVRMGSNEDIESDLFKNLGVAYARQRRNADALAAFTRALQLGDKASGPEHVRRSIILGNMGSIYKREGRLEEASRVLTEAIAIRERISGPNHPMGSLLHYSLAQALLPMRAFSKAQAHARRALEIDQATYGPENPQVGDTYDVVGAAYLQDGKYQEAREAYQRALDIKEKALGKDHENVSYSAGGLAGSLLGLGEAAKAGPLFEQVLAINPSDPVILGDAYFGLARALESQGKDRSRALTLARKARELFESAKVTEGVEEVGTWIAERSTSKRGR